ncbi:MAG TPA: hypothetical protein VNG31_03225 [Candidatus Baltobacteraceae bacterium]|nr:hypothetical protein [Candidatus Baltobacteraceae bacterium]
MKPVGLLDAPGAQALHFAWLSAAVAPATEYGEREFVKLRPFSAGDEAAAQARCQRIAAVATAAGAACLDAVREALRAAPDAVGAIARASMGDVLEDADFFELQRFCDAAERVDALLAGVEQVGAVRDDAVQATARALDPGRTGKYGFYLADRFDADLGATRAALSAAQAELDAARGRTLRRIAAELERDDLSGDEFIVMRAELHRPLPAGVRVVREAPTYYLCALEFDETALLALARRDAAADAVAGAEETVRAKLSAVVRAHAAQLGRAAERLGEVDVLVAAARFTLEHGCRPAHIVAQPVLAFTGGRFLPLLEELETQGRTFTSIDIELHDVAVLTGPNMGGKSVCLRTCGFIALCAAFGLPVPARDATAGLFDEIAWLGVGSEDAVLGDLLSSFAKEVVRLRDVLARGAKRLLVLIDEFARTTTPHEGKALLVAVVDRLGTDGACGLVATHLSGVAGQAGVRHFAVRGLRGLPQRPPTGNLHEALAALAGSMDYTVAEVGTDERSRADAIALAALLGLDDDLVESAYSALRDS